MYYFFIPGICLCLFVNLCIKISKDSTKKFKSLDYKSSFYLRSTRAINEYIEDIDELSKRTQMKFSTRTLPPYSDYSIYNILDTQDKESRLLKLFEE